MEWLMEPQAWAALLTLTALEIVLGIDNIIFISILVGRLPKAQQERARILGLSMAMLTRILLLFSLTWLMGLVAPLFTVFEEAISGRDLILILGGLFLLAKSTFEIHGALEGPEEQHEAGGRGGMGFWLVIVQIGIIDIVFSLDSVITAIGMAQHIEVMIIAVVISVLVMMLAARPISEFIDRHPTLKMLALSFLVLIGVALIAEGLDLHIPKGYIYFAMAYAFSVEILNQRIRARARKPLHLRKQYAESDNESSGS